MGPEIIVPVVLFICIAAIGHHAVLVQEPRAS
jgi:hypothetical protein